MSKVIACIEKCFKKGYNRSDKEMEIRGQIVRCCVYVVVTAAGVEEEAAAAAAEAAAAEEVETAPGN